MLRIDDYSGRACDFMTAENYNYYRHRRRSRLFSGKLARSFLSVSRPGLINCQFGVGWFQLLSATTASLRSTDAVVINGCLAPARRGRKVWILLRGLKTPFRKKLSRVALIEFINYGTNQCTRTRLISRYNPADLSISRDSVGWFRRSLKLMHYANVIWRTEIRTWVDERGRAEKTMSL